METVKNNLNNLKLFYDHLNREYRVNLTNWNVLVQNHNLVVSELNWVKEQRPNITLAEYDKLKQDLVAENNKVFILTQEKLDLGKTLTNQQTEINNLKAELASLTNQRILLQTEKDNLTTSYQTLQNDYTNLATTANIFQVERDSLQVELQNKDNELNSHRTTSQLEKIQVREDTSKKVLETIIKKLGIKVKEITTE